MAKYLPFLDGKYSTAPGLNAMAKADEKEQLVFQLDEDYAAHLHNKHSCREEDIHKYHLEKDLPADTIVAVNQFFVNELVKEYPKEFFFSAGERTLQNRKTEETLRWRED